MSGISPEEMAKASEILESVRDDWLKRPGVTAVDLGFKWSQGQMTGSLAIRVHVSQKKNKDELTDSEMFPKDIDGIAVDVIEATYAPQALVDVRPEAAQGGRGKRFDIVPIGVSIGCKHSTAGTLGAKVFDLDSGEEMILSNWHVLVGREDVEAGLATWQPGWIDGGTNDNNTIARLTRWVLGPYDAAVATITGDREIKTSTVEGTAVEDITAPMLGMMVWKSGRSTGHTEGFIDGVKMKIPLSYRHAGTHTLEEVIRIVPRPGAPPGEISIGGDSGSIWVDEASGKAVGLHFAGEVGDNPEHALANDITAVVKRLNIRFPAQIAPAKPKPKPDPAPDPVLPPPKPKPDPAPDPVLPPPKPIRSRRRRSFWDSIGELLRRLFR